jgi:transcriptional regulator
VPTWNYAVVHAHGPIRFIDARDWLRGFVDRLTRHHEAGRRDPWHITDAPPDYIETLLGAIIGLEIPIARLVGKWKVSQNRPAEDRAGVVDALLEDGGSPAAAMARLVRDASRDAGGPSS